jgi:hypothetical protein
MNQNYFVKLARSHGEVILRFSQDSASPGLLVNCQWLAQHLDDPQVVVVDCRFKLSDRN